MEYREDSISSYNPKGHKKINKIEEKFGISFVNHQEEINSIFLTSDLKTIITSSSDLPVCIWDRETFTQVYKVENSVNYDFDFAADLSKNEELVAYLDSKSCVRVINLKTKQMISKLKYDKNQMFILKSIFFAHHPTKIFLIYYSVIKLWDFKNDSIIELVDLTDSLNLFQGFFLSRGDYKIKNLFCESPNGNLFAYSFSSSEINVATYEDPENQEIFELKLHVGTILCIKISEDGQLLFSSATDKFLIVWNLKKREKKYILCSRRDIITTFQLSEKSTRIIAASDKGKIRILNYTDRKLALVLSCKSLCIHSLAASNDSKIIITYSDTLKLWDLNGKVKFKEPFGHNKKLKHIEISKHNKLAASCSLDKTIRIWNLKNRKEITVIRNTSGFVRVCFSHDNKYVLGLTKENVLKVYNLETKKCIRYLNYYKQAIANGKSFFNDLDQTNYYMDSEYSFLQYIYNHKIYGIALLSDNVTALTIIRSRNSSYLLLWDLELKFPITIMTFHNMIAKTIKLTENGRYFVVATTDQYYIIRSNKQESESISNLI